MTVIHLLGSEGFIGKAIQNDVNGLNLQCWSHINTERSNYFNLFDQSSWDMLIQQKPTHVILLSWPGLPKYNDPSHLTLNLPACVGLIERLMQAGLQKLVVTGTCYEYGLQNGELSEDQFTDPVNCYSTAKDSFRRFIESRCTQNGVQWSWLRIFYPYGPGQNPNSLLPSLDKAIEEHIPQFSISSGRQIRDFLPVELVARDVLEITTNPAANGIYNVCSGVPRSIREIVETRIHQKNAKIALSIGDFPDRTDEPLAFWGSAKRINALYDRASVVI